MKRVRPLSIAAVAVAMSLVAIGQRSTVVHSQQGTPLPPLPSLPNGQPQTHTPCATAPPKANSMFVPLAHVTYFGAADLMLNNRGIVVRDIVPTWYIEGESPIVGETIHLPAGRATFYDIRTFLPPHIRLSQVQGLKLAYDGHLREVWAQAILRPARNAEPSQSLDAPFSMAADFKGSTLETVWPVTTRNARAVVALANTSDAAITVAVASSESLPGKREDVKLPAHSGKLINMSVHAGPRTAGGAWMRLTSSGAPGALRALGFIANNQDRVPRLTRFVDRAAANGRDLFATGLSTVNIRATVSLRNIGEAPLVGTVDLLRLDSADVVLSVATVSLAPGDATVVPFDPSSLAGLDRVTVRVRNTGVVGSLVGALHATDVITGLGYELPLRDIGPARASTGGYPWRLDGDYETVVSITNVGTTSATFHARLHYGNTDYKPKPVQLQPGQTATFDIRKLRDQRVRDSGGQTIPASLTSGQFYWSTERSDGRFSGRAEIVSINEHVSSSFSCWQCCGDSVTGSYAYLDGENNIGIGRINVVSLSQNWEDCNGYYMGNYGASGLWTYNSGILSLATISGDYYFTGISNGSTSPTAAMWEQEWRQESENANCEDTSHGRNVGIPGTSITVACALPTNFRKDHAVAYADGVLGTQYNWDSTIGSNANLAACIFQENVAYPGGNPYSWPTPFPALSITNPFIWPPSGVPGTDGSSVDFQRGGDETFRTPYTANNFTAYQTFEFSCTCYNNGAWTQIWGPKSIYREVWNASGWKYKVEKDGDEAHRNIP